MAKKPPKNKRVLNKKHCRESLPCNVATKTYNLYTLNRDVENLELDNACWYGNLYYLALLLAEQSLCDRSADSQLSLTEVSLVLRYDSVGNLTLVVVVKERYFAQNLYLVLLNLALVNNS